MEFIFKNKSYILAGLLVALTACGGGGGGDPEPTPVNVGPTVSVSNITVAEATNVSITASASDVDGTIASYNWVIKSGEQVELSASDTNTVGFISPTVNEDSEMVLTVTVTDNDGATASTDVTVTISNTSAIQLTIKGKVVSSLAANATLLLEVAEQEYSASADENGNYSIDIDVEESFADKVIQITASGTGDNTALKLVSLLGDLAYVNIAAGDDGILTSDEIFAVNITGVSTAIAALLEESNNYQPIKTTIDLSKTSRAIYAPSILPLATAIELLAEYSAESLTFAFPEGIADTLTFAKNREVADLYIFNAKNDLSETYELVNNAVITNSQIISSGTAESLITVSDSYYFISVASIDGGGRMLLNSDGTGKTVNFGDEISYNWSKGNNGLSINYGVNNYIESDIYGYIDDVQDLVQIQTISTGKVIKWLFQSIQNDILLIENTTYRHYPNGEAQDTLPTKSYRSINAVKNAGLINAADTLQMGVEYSFVVPGYEEELIQAKDPEGDNLTNSINMNFVGSVADGGTVTLQIPIVSGDGGVTYSNRDMMWSINLSGHLILTGDVTYDYAFLTNNDDSKPYVNVLKSEANNSISISNHALKKISNGWTEQSATGIYNWENPSFVANEYFWIEVNSDGTATTIFATDSDLNETLTEDEINLYNGLWMINEENHLIIRRYKYSLSSDNRGNCTPESFDPADDAECVLFHEREIDLHYSLNEGQYFMKHSHRFYTDYAREWIVDPSVEGHLLWSSIIDNRSWRKVNTRPIEISTTTQALNLVKMNIKQVENVKEMISHDMERELIF